MNPLSDFGGVVINKAYGKKFVEIAVVFNISDNRFSRIPNGPKCRTAGCS
jgi:hypothetical protein